MLKMANARSVLDSFLDEVAIREKNERKQAELISKYREQYAEQILRQECDKKIRSIQLSKLPEARIEPLPFNIIVLDDSDDEEDRDDEIDEDDHDHDYEDSTIISDDETVYQESIILSDNDEIEETDEDVSMVTSDAETESDWSSLLFD